MRVKRVRILVNGRPYTISGRKALILVRLLSGEVLDQLDVLEVTTRLAAVMHALRKMQIPISSKLFPVVKTDGTTVMVARYKILRKDRDQVEILDMEEAA